MKINEISLNVSIDDLKNTIEELVNGNDKYISVMNNLFMIKNINTCLRVKEGTYWFNHKYASFQISYNDENMKNLITIKYNFDNDSVYEFLKQTDYINFEQLQTINAKVMKLSKQFSSHLTIDESVDRVNDMLYNEALLLITSAINQEDFDAVKSDFESRYEKWLEHKNAINEQGVLLINDFYNNLLKIKLSEKD